MSLMMKKYILFMLAILSIHPVNCSSTREEEIVEMAKRIVSLHAEKAQIETISQLSEKLLGNIAGNKNDVLLLAKNLYFLPPYRHKTTTTEEGVTLFPDYTKPGIAVSIVNSLRNKDHINFNFDLDDKKEILEIIRRTMLSFTRPSSFDSPYGVIWSVARENTNVYNLCLFLLSDQGIRQLTK